MGILDTKHTFIGFVISNVAGSLDMSDNCFIHNQVSVAPVVSFSGAVSATHNSGIVKKHQIQMRACEFIAVVQNLDTDGADEENGVSEEDFVFTKDMSFLCHDFDVGASNSDSMPSCNAVSVGADNNETIIGGHNFPKSSPEKNLDPDKEQPGSHTLVICLLVFFSVLVVSVLVMFTVSVVKRSRAHRRRLRSSSNSSNRSNIHAVCQFT